MMRLRKRKPEPWTPDKSSADYERERLEADTRRRKDATELFESGGPFDDASLFFRAVMDATRMGQIKWTRFDHPDPAMYVGSRQEYVTDYIGLHVSAQSWTPTQGASMRVLKATDDQGAVAAEVFSSIPFSASWVATAHDKLVSAVVGAAAKSWNEKISERLP